MSIIIRLQRLPWSASAADVREFFRGLTIPEGGVHIVGGRDGDAFIAFASDEDARLAMRNDGKRIKESKIKLLLSSRAEMQKVIDKARHEFTSLQDAATFDDDASQRRKRSRSRSRSPATHSSAPKPVPQPQQAVISGFSSFKPNAVVDQQFGMSEMQFAAGPLPPSSSFKPGMFDRSLGEKTQRNTAQIGQVFDQPNSESSMFGGGNKPQQYPPQRVLNEAAFTAGNSQNIDFDGRPPTNTQTFQTNSQNQFSTNSQNQFPIQNQAQRTSSTVPRNRRALLPEPDELAPPYVAEPMIPTYNGPPPMEDAFYRGAPSTFKPPPQFGRKYADDTLPYYDAPPRFDGPNPNLDFSGGGMNQNSYGERQPMYFEPPMPMPPPMYHNDFYDRAPPPMYGRSVCMDDVPVEMLRYGEIRVFYHPMALDGPDSIKIIADEYGEKIGRVYCRFNDRTDAQAALLMDRRQGIRIRPCGDEEYESVADCRAPETGYKQQRGREYNNRESNRRQEWDVVEGRWALEMTNIPYKCDDAQIWELIEYLRPAALKRKMKYQNNTMLQSDTAYVEFDNEKDASECLMLNGRRLLGRPINVRQSSKVIVDQENTRFYKPRPTRRSPEADEDGGHRHGSGGRSRRRGEERRGDERRSRGNSSTSDEPGRYDRRDDESSRSYRSDGDRRERSGRDQQHQEKDQVNVSSSSENRTAAPPANPDKHSCLFMSGLPPNVQARDVMSFFTGLRIAHGGVRLMREPRGAAYVEFCSSRDCDQALAKNREYIGVQMVTLKACSKTELTDAVQKQHGITTQRSSVSPNNTPETATKPADQRPSTSEEAAKSSNGAVVVSSTTNDAADGQSACTEPVPITPMPEIDTAVVGDLGLAGVVCFLHNLPPKITLEEICGLFPTEQMLDDSVRMHYNQTSEPTGDCLLAFATLNDAERACERINATSNFGRQLTMCVVAGQTF